MKKQNVSWEGRKILYMMSCFEVGTKKGTQTIPNVLRGIADYLEHRATADSVKSRKQKNSSLRIPLKIHNEFMKAVGRGKRFHGVIWYSRWVNGKWVALPQTMHRKRRIE
jgi:hypothetical protein